MDILWKPIDLQAKDPSDDRNFAATVDLPIFVSCHQLPQWRYINFHTKLNLQHLQNGSEKSWKNQQPSRFFFLPACVPTASVVLPAIHPTSGVRNLSGDHSMRIFVPFWWLKKGKVLPLFLWKSLSHRPYSCSMAVVELPISPGSVKLQKHFVRFEVQPTAKFVKKGAKARLRRG